MSEHLDLKKVTAALKEAAKSATTGSKLERAGRFIWVRAHMRKWQNGKKVQVRPHERPSPSASKK